MKRIGKLERKILGKFAELCLAVTVRYMKMGTIVIVPRK